MSKIAGFISETIIYGFANVFSRIFAMLLIPLYVGFLGKIDYSNLIMLQSTFAILTLLLALNSGVFYYYYEYTKIRYQKIVFTSWFYYALIISLLIIVLLSILSLKLTSLFITTDDNKNTIQWCLILVGIQLIPYVFNNTNINLFRIDRKPKMVMLMVALEAFLTFLFIYFSLKILKGGLIEIIISQILARSFVCLYTLKNSLFFLSIYNFSKKLLIRIISYSWPYFIITGFAWIIISIDKFIGAQYLTDKTEVAILALASQLVIPMIILSDMIRMAIGPYIMSIRKEMDAEKSYQQIFEISIFVSSFVTVVIVMATPFLTLILADPTYLVVIKIMPLITFANILSLASNQFSVSFSLVKKNIYILYAFAVAGTVGILINLVFMKYYGFIISGISQIISYVIMSLMLYLIGKRIANQKLKLKNSCIILIIVIIYITIIMAFSQNITNENYSILIICSFLTLLSIYIIYLKQQKISLLFPYQIIKQKLKFNL